jgi:hypothetical protein
MTGFGLKRPGGGVAASFFGGILDDNSARLKKIERVSNMN